MSEYINETCPYCNCSIDPENLRTCNICSNYQDNKDQKVDIFCKDCLIVCENCGIQGCQECGFVEDCINCFKLLCEDCMEDKECSECCEHYCSNCVSTTSCNGCSEMITICNKCYETVHCHNCWNSIHNECLKDVVCGACLKNIGSFCPQCSEHYLVICENCSQEINVCPNCEGCYCQICKKYTCKKYL